MIPLFVLPFTLLVVLASSTSGDHHFCEIVTPCRPPPIRIEDERERLVTASPVMKKSRAPAGGNSCPENCLVKPPRRDTRALSPTGMFGGKAPLRLAADKSRPHAPLAGAYAQYTCLLSLQIGSINKSRLDPSPKSMRVMPVCL